MTWHHLAVLAAAGLGAFIAGVAVIAAVTAAVMRPGRDRIRQRMIRRRRDG